MTLTLELSPEREAAFKAQAQARGMSVEEWLLELTKPTGPARSLQDELTPEEWVRQLNAWVESHDRTTPLLSDDAISRESIYADRV